ncbi:MAG: hypothetical protein ABI619_00245 [Betaproteobacteria bacterium]
MSDMIGNAAAPAVGSLHPAPALRWPRVHSYAFALIITVSTIAVDSLLWNWLEAQPLVIVAVISIIVSARELILKPNTAHEFGRVLDELLREGGLRPRASTDHI